MVYKFRPRGVCSNEMHLEIEGSILKKLTVIGGCHGNLLGISSLAEGMEIDEIIRRLKGIRCGMKDTSCPDQLARALEQAKKKAAE